MVSATSQPAVLKVSFSVLSNEVLQVEVVCIVRAAPDGRLDINYSHNLHRSRSSPQGPWGKEQIIRHTLNQALIAQIQYGVFTALWETFGNRVRVLPADPNASLDNIKW